jgi:uncharacterized protein YqeY
MNKITEELKKAMRLKDTIRLESIRAIKSELLLLQTRSGGTDSFSKGEENKVLQKLIKQRKESAAIYKEQDRNDLEILEQKQANIILEFLPKQLDLKEIENIVSNIINDLGVNSIKDMGKVMSIANKQISGRTDGSTIASVVKQKLT